VTTNIRDIRPDYSQAVDLGDMILHECICGSNEFRIIATFDDYEIASYFTDAECLHCGSKFKCPTAIDRPGYV